MEMPVALTKAAVLLSSPRLPYSLSLRSVGSGHVSPLIASYSRQCCSRCSAVMMSALHGHISDSPTLNLLYMWALSLLCPVLNLSTRRFVTILSSVGIEEPSSTKTNKQRVRQKTITPTPRVRPFVRVAKTFMLDITCKVSSKLFHTCHAPLASALSCHF